MRFPTNRFRWAMRLGGLTFHDAALCTWNKINEHAILTRAAAITFYAIAALVPFMALLIALTADWLPWVVRQAGGTAVADLESPLDALLPADVASFLAIELRRLQTQRPAGFVSFGLAAVLWLSSSVFVEIMDAMNFILGVTETRPFWKRRTVAIIMTLSQAAILIAAVVTSMAWPQIIDFLHLSRAVGMLATALHYITIFVVVLMSFALALYIAPDADQHWEWITPGSVLGTIVLLICSVLFRIYAQHWGNYSATYGSLAGTIGFMTWFWLSAVVLLAAAELNNVIKEASPFGRSRATECGPVCAGTIE